MSAARKNTTDWSSSLVVGGSGTLLYSLRGFNNSGSSQWIQLHEATTLPADGAVPVFFFEVPAGKAFALDLGSVGEIYSGGLVVCNSSTKTPKTIGAADCWFVANTR